jgi:hypothetical protein
MADVSWDNGSGPRRTQLRILGDDTRGYILMGAFALSDQDEMEFWFATLDEAKGAAQKLGVPAHAWGDVTTVEQVGVRRPGER